MLGESLKNEFTRWFGSVWFFGHLVCNYTVITAVQFVQDVPARYDVVFFMNISPKTPSSLVGHYKSMPSTSCASVT